MGNWYFKVLPMFLMYSMCALYTLLLYIISKDNWTVLFLAQSLFIPAIKMHVVDAIKDSFKMSRLSIFNHFQR